MIGRARHDNAINAEIRTSPSCLNLRVARSCMVSRGEREAGPRAPRVRVTDVFYSVQSSADSVCVTCGLYLYVVSPRVKEQARARLVCAGSCI